MEGSAGSFKARSSLSEDAAGPSSSSPTLRELAVLDPLVASSHLGGLQEALSARSESSATLDGAAAGQFWPLGFMSERDMDLMVRHGKAAQGARKGGRASEEEALVAAAWVERREKKLATLAQLGASKWA